MSGTLGALLAERRAEIVGRDAELAGLLDLVERPAPLVVVVHGVAGAGKSSLLRAFEARAAAQDAVVVPIDGRAVEPTPQGLRAACAAADPEGALAGRDGRVVLTIDSAERLRLLDGWLRQEFLPGLPEHARVVVATRDTPGAAWRVPFGSMLRCVPLGPLAPAAALELLRRAGLDEDGAVQVNAVVRGHPLSLTLAASAVLEHPGEPVADVLPAVVRELAALYVDGLDAATRDALDATCVLRRVTRSQLAAVLPDVPPQEAFDRLAALPFVELGAQGLVVHDTVRESLAALLRAGDPVRHRRLRAAAWRQIRDELRQSAGPARWGALADMINLVDEPLVREAFFPSTVQHYAIEAATAADWPAIEAIVSRHEPPEHVALIQAWWEAVPEAFRVARSPRRDVVALAVLCEPARVPSHLLFRDPVVRPWQEHLRADPVPRGQQVIFARLALAHGTRDAPSPCLTALLRDVERACLEAGPALRRVYSTCRGEDLLRQLAPLGYRPLPGAREVSVGGAPYQAIACDLGPESVAGWLAGLAARDLPVDDDAVRLDRDARELALAGRRIELTRLECDVLAYLQDREDQAVARETLLRDVWGYEWTGGSNVVEVAVSGLRRKLGDRAGALQTVRGVGYRLRPFAGAAAAGAR